MDEPAQIPSCQPRQRGERLRRGRFLRRFLFPGLWQQRWRLRRRGRLMKTQASDYFSGAIQHLHTVRDYLRFAVSRFNQAKLFFGHGSNDAYDEAAYLILHTLHLPPDRLDPFLDARLTDGERSEVLGIIQRRVEQRIPAAYLTHEAFLGEFSFYEIG